MKKMEHLGPETGSRNLKRKPDTEKHRRDIVLEANEQGEVMERPSLEYIQQFYLPEAQSARRAGIDVYASFKKRIQRMSEGAGKTRDDKLMELRNKEYFQWRDEDFSMLLQLMVEQEQSAWKPTKKGIENFVLDRFKSSNPDFRHILVNQWNSWIEANDTQKIQEEFPGFSIENLQDLIKVMTQNSEEFNRGHQDMIEFYKRSPNKPAHLAKFYATKPIGDDYIPMIRKWTENKDDLTLDDYHSIQQIFFTFTIDELREIVAHYDEIKTKTKKRGSLN